MFNCTLPPYLRNRRLVLNDNPGDGGGGNNGNGGDQPPAKTEFVDEKGKKWGFPAETPVAEMTDAQAKEYWRYHAKKHEKQRRPDDFDQLVADAQRWREAQNGNPAGGEQPPAVDTNALRTEARREGIVTTLPTLLELAIRSTNPDIDDDDVEEIIDDLDLTKFVTATGEIDSARVQKLAKKHAATASEANQPGTTGDPLAQALGHHQQQPGGSSPAGGSVAALREQARERIQPKKS